MQNIRNIIFDLGGVILDIDFKRLEKAFVDLGVTNFHDFFGLGHAAAFFKEHESGKISDREFLESLQKLTPHSLSPEQLKRAWNSLLIRFPPKRIAFLKQLKSRYHLFLLSNTNAIHAAAFENIYEREFNNGSLSELFDEVYYSHLLGIRKPDKEVYEYVLTDSNLNPRETVFIDDALVNVEAARETGMWGIHLQSGKTIMELGL